MAFEMILIVAIISFFSGFFIHLIALPYIVGNLANRCWTYLKNISMKFIFRWSVSFIVSFSIGALIIQTQETRIREEVDRKYQHIIDSIKCDMDILKHNKIK